MRENKLNKWKFPAAALLAIAIFLHPQTAVDSARNAMAMWYSSVAPAIFPFLALMPLLTGPDACAAYEKIFSRLMRVIFRLPGSAAPAFIISLISGSPAGAVAISQMAGHSGMTHSQLRRFAPVVCGVSPAYLTLGIGVGLFGSVHIGLRIAAVQLLAQLVLLLLLRLQVDEAGEPLAVIPIAPRTGMRHAVSSTMTVCGCMVLFSVAASVLAETVGNLLGKILLLLADLPSGMAMLSQWNVPGKNLLLGMAVGFGGLCVISQNMDVLHPLGLSWKDMLGVKFVQSALSGALLPLVLRENCRGFNPILRNNAASYVFSLLIALLLSLPVLIYLSNKLFLNKSKQGKSFSS